MNDFGAHLFEQANLIAQAQIESLRGGIAIGRRESAAVRAALAGIIAAHDRHREAMLPIEMLAAIESARGVLK